MTGLQILEVMRIMLNVELCGVYISFFLHRGTSMYYVSTKGGGRGSAKCLRLLTGGGRGSKGSCLRNQSLEKKC